jgi:hypothetical protein
MEKSNKVERSEVWNNIYKVLARLDLKQVEGDSSDRPSAATQIEEAVKKLSPIHNVSISLRDRFALAVVTGLTSATDTNGDWTTFDCEEAIAEMAYNIADKCMERRKQ